MNTQTAFRIFKLNQAAIILAGRASFYMSRDPKRGRRAGEASMRLSGMATRLLFNLLDRDGQYDFRIAQLKDGQRVIQHHARKRKAAA